MKKHDPAMAVCPGCGSRLVISGRVGHTEKYQRVYLCGAIYYDRDLHLTTEVCSEIKRLRTEYDAVLDAAVESDGRWMQAVSDLIAERDEAQRELAKAREIIECRHDHD